MATYTSAQLQQLWIDAGGDPTKAQQAAAIALAESGGNSNSVNSSNSNGTVDRGLWQINSVHGALSTFDPLANARAAVQISGNGQNWKPWCVAWSNGDCSGTFLGPTSPIWRIVTPLGSALFNGGVSAAGGAVQDAAKGVLGNIFGSLTKPVWNTFVWVSAVVAGVFGMFIGFVIIFWSSGVPQAAVNVVIGGAQTKQAVNVLKPKKTAAIVPAPAPTPDTGVDRPAEKPEPIFPVGSADTHRKRLAATEDELRTSLIRPPRHRRRRRVARVGDPRHLAEGDD